MGRLLWIIIVALIVFWLIGFAMKIGGGLIHLLLVIAGIVFVIQLLTGRRSV
ncbi:lmo0937 family membrane protein [Sporosarcina oncorhynchi]|uniref:Lmo0937 family membrane protein n=1 Tax=Sporosarcina oncorhynchi TaxID=3056444 RepID=A0ABZ0L6X0_9BACL|nr:lmo0937 family membrane protein [Sporosarcina sp. T2O-4]WOV87124.1 lmo0937 family membrane protein [Sporosarcina sp. T2O-4]